MTQEKTIAKVKIKNMPDLLKHFMINFGEEYGLPSDPEAEVDPKQIEKVIEKLSEEAF